MPYGENLLQIFIELGKMQRNRSKVRSGYEGGFLRRNAEAGGGLSLLLLLFIGDLFVFKCVC